MEAECGLCIFEDTIKVCLDCDNGSQFIPRAYCQKSKGQRCEICGQLSFALEWHHIFRGAHRAMAELLGYKIAICRQCHEKIHADHEFEARLRAEYERRHIKLFGVESLIRVFGSCQSCLEGGDAK